MAKLVVTTYVTLLLASLSVASVVAQTCQVPSPDGTGRLVPGPCPPPPPPPECKMTTYAVNSAGVVIGQTTVVIPCPSI